MSQCHSVSVALQLCVSVAVRVSLCDCVCVSLIRTMPLTSVAVCMSLYDYQLSDTVRVAHSNCVTQGLCGCVYVTLGLCVCHLR